MILCRNVKGNATLGESVSSCCDKFIDKKKPKKQTSIMLIMMQPIWLQTSISALFTPQPNPDGPQLSQTHVPAECDSLWKVYDIFLLNGKHIILHVVKMFSINIQIERPLYMSKYIYYSQLIKSDYQEEVLTEVSFTLDVTHYTCLSASTLTRVWCK